MTVRHTQPICLQKHVQEPELVKEFVKKKRFEFCSTRGCVTFQLRNSLKGALNFVTVAIVLQNVLANFFFQNAKPCRVCRAHAAARLVFLAAFVNDLMQAHEVACQSFVCQLLRSRNSLAKLKSKWRGL